MMPRIAKCYANGEKDQIKTYMNKTFKFVYMLGFPLIFGIIAVSNSFVPIFFGQGYDKIKVLLKIMSLIIIFIGLSNITGSQYLLSTKKQKQFTISVVCGAIVNALFNVILIRLFKSLGAVIATVIAEFVVTLVQFYFIRSEFSIKNIIKLSKDYIISALAMFIIIMLTGSFINSEKIKILVQVNIGIIVYFTILLIKKDELIIELKQRFYKKAKDIL